MKIIIFSTGCPQCRVLEAKLKQKGIEYEVVNDIAIMTEKGYMSVPVLEVDDVSMTFKQAVDWVNKQ
jgi:glutaredoxin